jgi:glycosyltransferase involved in cell wall biosynthesis
MSIAVIILTFNEESHIARCIKSTTYFSDEVFVVDSFSTDNTVLIAKQLGAKVFQHSFVNQSQQLNWFLETHSINSQWVLRLDADEIITLELAKTLEHQISLFTPDIAGATINRRIYFQGKWIRYGGIYPIPVVRLWRNKQAVCEDRWMDEHMIIDGKITSLKGDLSDINLNSLTWWIDKHNHYASREAIEILLAKDNILESPSCTMKLDLVAARKRWIKEVVYSKIPLGVRALLYFIYRYFLKFGFLDGSKGTTFHVLQGFWYRFLVDQKVKELEYLMRKSNSSLDHVVRQEYKIDINKLTNERL